MEGIQKFVETVVGSNPALWMAIAFALLALWLVLDRDSVNEWVRHWLDKTPAGKRVAAKAASDTQPISQTMIALGSLSSAMLQLTQVFQPLAEELRRTNDVNAAGIKLASERAFTQDAQHNALMTRFEAHEKRTEERTVQMNGVTAQLKEAVEAIQKNNSIIQAAVDNETRSFKIREAATAQINGQLQALALGLEGMTKSVGRVGTTATDMGGEVEDIKDQLAEINRKIDSLTLTVSNLVIAVQNALPNAPAPLLGPFASTTPPAVVVAPTPQSEIKTATLPPTTPLEGKGPDDAKPETNTLTEA